MKARGYTLLAASVAAVAGMLTVGGHGFGGTRGGAGAALQQQLLLRLHPRELRRTAPEVQRGPWRPVSVAGGTSSGANNTTNYWEGINKRGPISDGIFTWAPGTEANLGKAQNDKINFFKVK